MVTKRQIEEQIAHSGAEIDERFAELLAHTTCEGLCDRRNFEGHITASGTVIHLPTQQMLLLHHKGLGKWLQPGGHIEPGDESPLAAALREIEEETGITPSELVPMNVGEDGVQYCVEVNSHPIPLNDAKGEAAHWHHDFRFLFGYAGSRQIRIDARESLDYIWQSQRFADLGCHCGPPPTSGILG